SFNLAALHSRMRVPRVFQAPFQSLRSQLLSSFALLAAALLILQVVTGLADARRRTDSEMSALARGVLLSTATTLDRVGDAGDRGAAAAVAPARAPRARPAAAGGGRGRALRRR